MKLRRLPEDFQVDELNDLRPSGGPFALYRLEKRSLTTSAALDAVRESWNIDLRQLGVAGLKDRHAVTSQSVTIHHGPRRSLSRPGFSFQYLGQVPRPVTSHDIRANRFRITLRDLSESDAAAAVAALQDAARAGVANYFDEQRFGSLGESGEFIGHAWCRGDYERCLWLALAEPNVHDRAEEKRQKQLLRDHWGRWPECKAALARSHRRSVITFLADRPGDFKGAWAVLRVDLRRLYLAAYQSDLWNRCLAEWLRRELPEECLVPATIGAATVVLLRRPPPAAVPRLRQARIPLPSARQHLEPGPMADLLVEVLARQGAELRELRVKHPRDSFFSKGDRAVLVTPVGAAQEEWPDELHPGRRKLNLAFTLPRGAYATMLVKRLTTAAGLEVEDLDESPTDAADSPLGPLPDGPIPPEPPPPADLPPAVPLSPPDSPDR